MGQERRFGAGWRRDGWARWFAFAALLAALAVLLGYYYAHKPLHPQTAIALARTLLDAIIAVLIVALAGGLGHLLAPANPPSPLVNLAVQAALGLGILSLAALCLGVVGGLTTAVMWIALIGGLVLLARDVVGWWRQWSALPSLIGRSTRSQRAMAVLLAILVGTSLVQAAAPPVQFDALVYHLLLPKIFLAHRSIALVPDVPYWGNPLGAELLYTWAMALARPQAASLLGWFVGLLACLGVLGMGGVAQRTAGWAAAAALLAGESVSAALGWAYVDWFACLYGVALLGVITSVERPGRRTLLFGGLLVGFAFGTKYTAGVLLFSGAAAMAAAWPEGRRPRTWLAFGLAALLAAIPWLLKNWVGAGTPLYPFVGASAWIPAARQAALHASVSGGGVWQAIFLPLTATLLGHEKAPGFSSSIGPLLLGLSFGVLLVPRRLAPLARTVGAFVVTGWVVWAVASLLSPMLVQTRLYFALLPGWALLAGLGTAGISRVRFQGVRVRRIIETIIGITLALTVVYSSVNLLTSRPFDSVAGVETEESFRLRSLGAYQLAVQGVASLPDGRRVLMLWEPRGFECWPRCSPDAWIDCWYVARRIQPSTEAIVDSWTAEGYTDLLINLDGAAYVRGQDARYTEEDWSALDRMLGSLPAQGSFGDGYRLYRLP